MPEYEVPVGEGIEVSLEGKTVKVKGPKGELAREFRHPHVKVEKGEGKLVITSDSERRKVKSLAGTWRGHLNNMITGVSKGFECNLKLVYAHFPVKLETQENKLIIKNFLGERSSRTAEILDGVEIKIQGDVVTLSGIDKEKVGQTAANMEHKTKVKGFDKRVFQDGLYVTQKAAPPEGGS